MMGFQDLLDRMTRIERKTDRLDERFDRSVLFVIELVKELRQAMAIIDDLRAAWEAEKAADAGVVAKLDAANAKVAELEAALAAATTAIPEADVAALTALKDEVVAHAAEMASKG